MANILEAKAPKFLSSFGGLEPIKRILILGSSGRFGRYLTAHFNDLNVEVDSQPIRLSTPQDFNQIARLDHYDMVFNSLGLVGIDSCQNSPRLAKVLNQDLPSFLSEESKKQGFKLVQFSTPSVFSGKNAPNFESDEPDSPSVYGITKYQGEKLSLLKNPKTLIIRLNFFGLHPSKNTLVHQILNFAKNKEGFEAFGDVWFNPMYAMHAAQVSVKLLEWDASGIFHIGSPESVSKYEFAKLIYEVLGLDGSLVRCIEKSTISRNPLFSSNTVLRSNKVAKLGISIPSLNEGIEALLREINGLAQSPNKI